MFIRFFAIVLIGLISNQAIVSATCFGVNDVTIVTPSVSLDGTMLYASTTGQKIRVSYTPSADTNAVVHVESQQSDWNWEERPFGVKVVTADQPTPFMGGSTQAKLSPDGFMWSDMNDEAVVTYGLVGGQEYHFYFQWAPSFLSFGFSGVCIEDDTSSKADVCTTLECGGCLLEDDGPWKFGCELPEDMDVDECGDEGGDYCPSLAATPSPVTPAPVTPSPVTPAPVTPSPVTPSPVTPSPVTPAPVTPAPVNSGVTPAPVFQKVCRSVWAATHPAPATAP